MNYLFKHIFQWETWGSIRLTGPQCHWKNKMLHGLISSPQTVKSLTCYHTNLSAGLGKLLHLTLQLFLFFLLSSSTTPDHFQCPLLTSTSLIWGLLSSPSDLWPGKEIMFPKALTTELNLDTQDEPRTNSEGRWEKLRAEKWNQQGRFICVIALGLKWQNRWVLVFASWLQTRRPLISRQKTHLWNLTHAFMLQSFQKKDTGGIKYQRNWPFHTSDLKIDFSHLGMPLPGGPRGSFRKRDHDKVNVQIATVRIDM